MNGEANEAPDQGRLDQSIRNFLSDVGVNSRQAILRAVEDARRQGSLAGNEMFPIRMTLEIPSLQITMRFEAEIELEQL
jgi:hypothetical protein